MQDTLPTPDVQTTVDVPPPLKPPTLFTVLPYIMLPMAMAAIDSTMVTTALPAIVSTLGGVTHVSWIVVASLVTGVIAAPVYGQLRDVVGSRRMMLIALAVFLVGSLLCASATSLTMLVLCRCLQGLGGGGLMTLSQAIIGETIPPLERAKYQGYLAAVMVTATSIGPLIGGTLTTHFGWRSMFLFNVPLAALAMYLSRSAPVRPPVARTWGFDFPGLMLFVVFIAPFLIALDVLRAMDANTRGVGVGLLALSLMALAALLWQERRAFFPLLPVRFLGERTIWMSNSLAACHGAALVSLFTLLPLYLHVVRGASASEMGGFILPIMLGIGTGSMVTGRLVSRTGRTAIFPSVGLTIATLLLANQALHMETWSRLTTTISLLLCGASMGTVMGVVQVTVQSAAGRTGLGSAAASVQISRSVGAAIGTTITSALLFMVLGAQNPAFVPVFAALFEAETVAEVAPVAGAMVGIATAFRVAFLAVAGFAAIGAVIAWSIPKRRL